MGEWQVKCGSMTERPCACSHSHLEVLFPAALVGKLPGEGEERLQGCVA